MGIILWAPPVDTVWVQSTVTQTEVLCFDNYSGLLAFELVFSFSFIQLSLSLLFLLFVFEQHEENDEHERQQVFVGFAWFVSDALCLRRDWRRRVATTHSRRSSSPL